MRCFRSTQPSYRRVGLWLAIGVVALCPGCVRRRLLVRSNPPGAMVYVDNQPIGTTPCATSFVYYGTREIRLVMPGFETLTVKQPIPAPWYQIPPLDFVSENLTPHDVHDYRTVTYNMTPQVIVPTDDLIARGQQLRTGTQQGAALPARFEAAPGTPILNPPTITSPAVSPPTLAPPQAAPSWAPEQLGPGVLVPTTPGAEMLPPGGTLLQALPATQ